MSTSNLLYSDTEEALRASVRRLFAERCTVESVTSLYDVGGDDFTGLWKTMSAELGLAALLVPEELGGAGATARDAAVVMEEIGRATAPVPFLTSAVLATVALTTAGDVDTVRSLAEAEITASLVVPLSTMPGDFGSKVWSDGARISGRITSVAGASESDVLVVPVLGSDGPELHVVSADDASVSMTPVPSLDMSRQLADVEFSGAPSTRVDQGNAEESVRTALLTGAALLASEQFGLAQWCFETTLAYVKERKQFGRSIGSFQAIKHRLADLWLDVSAAGAAARYAADTLARGDGDAEIAATVAQSYGSGVAVRAAEECVQLHGGLGMTWEYPAHLYLKRAKADQLAFGTAYGHRSHLAGLIDLPVA